MKVVLYARVSSDSQDVDLSITAQLKALREYALKNGYEVVCEFRDEAKSGRTADRPAFIQMIGLAKAKQPTFNAILVWKLNRFARNRADSSIYKALLRKKGIDVISITELVDGSPSGQMMEGMIEVIDEYYSANMGQDIKRGMRENASRGFFNGSQPPYGFRVVEVPDGLKNRNKLEPLSEDSPEVIIVHRAFDMALRDIGCKGIATALNKDGFRTRSGERWGRMTVYRLLTNEAYCGTLVWGRNKNHPELRSGDPPVRKENTWAAIIQPNVFQIVQNKLVNRSPKILHPRTISSEYLLSGLLCCTCGRALMGHSAKSGKYQYYLCSKKYKQGSDACSAHPIPKTVLEEAVVNQIKQKVLTEENLEELVRLTNDDLKDLSGEARKKLHALEKESNEINPRLSKLYDALETGKLELNDIAPRIKELRNRQEELSKARVHLEADMVVQKVNEVDLNTIKAYANDLREILDSAGIHEQKAFLKSFIKKVVVDRDKVTIRYNLPKDGTGNIEETSVLPIVSIGGLGGTISRTDTTSLLELSGGSGRV
jgi:site-specific DNA recombinase